MFAQKSILAYEESTSLLFVRKTETELDFSTYFNSFNVALIKKYTDGKKLSFKADFSGEVTFQLIYQNQKSQKLLFDGTLENKEYVVELNDLPEDGIIYPKFIGDLSKFNLNGFAYEVDATSRPINPCVIFCTYHREDFIIPNLEKLKGCFDYLSHVIVVDNGKSLQLDNSFLKEHFSVIPNANLGGTGGFTRGMIEAQNRGFSHIFVMDDDITLLPEVVNKTLSLVSCLKEGHENDWLGFSMFPNDKPTIQFELGNKWNGIKMLINKHNLDLSKKENLLVNQFNDKYNYSAWWSLIMPTSVLDKYNYPFPFFIKFDDIEYGLRRSGEEIILTNGFGVWHEDFDKKYNPYLEYYLFRNALVTNSIHQKHPLSTSLVRYLGKQVKHYFKGWFIENTLMNIGINDFLKGPYYFMTLDIQQRNQEIREIAKKKVNIFKGIFVTPFVTIGYFFKLMFKFNKARKLYKESYSQLTSLQYWEGVFNNDK